ncbi:MAG TPA: glycine--tRNA ligase, partial [Candidatus Marinimicrobia bacterium]|nr:glycine--tRNA ligase [Candidatus Neomarinimicrobiota bacterium]
DPKSVDWSTMQCPKCGTTGKMTDPRQFNLMFKTQIGPVENEGSIAYLRPETAQGIYVNYLLVQGSQRLKVPFGIAQIGKAFRNEIVARNFIFRTREFEQLEMQYFVKPSMDDDEMKSWKEERFNFYIDDLGINKDKLRFHQHGDGELAHYAKEAWDIEYEFPFGWSEIEGIHNRTDFDLKRHQEFSGKNMQYSDQVANEKYFPYIIETSAGLNRMMLTVLADAHWEDTENNRTVLKLHPRLAPIKAVICPLVKKDGLPELARKIAADLKNHYKVLYDQQGSIGKRYYRQDEAGTPFGITVDYQSLDDQTVTLRHRDSQKQDRVLIAALVEKIGVEIQNWS